MATEPTWGFANETRRSGVDGFAVDGPDIDVFADDEGPETEVWVDDEGPEMEGCADDDGPEKEGCVHADAAMEARRDGRPTGRTVLYVTLGASDVPGHVHIDMATSWSEHYCLTSAVFSLTFCAPLFQ